MGWALALAAPASVQADSAAPLAFEGAWIRSAPAASPVMAGYVVILNPGEGESVIDAVNSEDFGAVEIHEMREVRGVVRMRPLQQLQVEPGQRVALAPGGLHLMLFRPQRALQVGDVTELVFEFRDGSRRAVDFTVRDADLP